MIIHLLKIIYSCFVFVYISMRFLRDSLIMFSVGQEGTTFAKVISLIVILCFLPVQKFLIKRINVEKIIYYGCMFFIIMLLSFHFNLFPTLKLTETSTGINKLIKLLNNLPILIFYVLSELFACFIVTNFWFMNNTLLKQHYPDNPENYHNLFTFSQIGCILAGGIALLCKQYLIYFMVLALLIGLLITKTMPPIKYYSEKIKTEVTNIDKKIFIIPIITLLCGMLTGIFDGYAKFQLKSVSPLPDLYVDRIAKVWILQSICIIVFSELFKFDFLFKRFITPFFIGVMIIIALISKNYLPCFVYASLIMSIMILFKAFKYAVHSPYKEQYIKNQKNMSSILIWEGVSGRIGKNSIAIILSILFSYGYSWNTIESESLIFVNLISIVWLILSFFIA